MQKPNTLDYMLLKLEYCKLALTMQRDCLIQIENDYRRMVNALLEADEKLHLALSKLEELC